MNTSTAAHQAPTPRTTPSGSHPAQVRPWYTHRWPWFLMLGPFIVVLAGIYTGYLAYTRQDALVVDDYYKQGKAINQDLRRDRAAAALGARIQLHYDAAGGKLVGVLRTTAPTVSGALHVRLVHSTLPEKDMAFDVLPDAQGRFAVPLAMLDMAVWRVQVENEGRVWRLHGGWIWPQDRQVELSPHAQGD